MPRFKLRTLYASDGSPYKLWTHETCRMPRIPTAILECSAYLYRSEEDAKSGRKLGGSGFLVGVRVGAKEPLDPDTPGPRLTGAEFFGERYKGPLHLYLVTNRHIARKGGHWARVNNWQGSSRIIDLRKGVWVHHPDLDEVSICPVSLETAGFSDRFRAIELDMFLTDRLSRELSVGPGEDVLMIGRFINHEGRQRNLPTARFGQIAMMPLEKIRSKGGLLLDGYLVEANSIAGYSGSPVFLSMEFREIRSFAEDETLMRRLEAAQMWRLRLLLGINWGHLEVTLNTKVTKGRRKEDVKLDLNAGMMCVSPAWKILEVLNADKLVELRARERELLESGSATED